MKPILYKDNNNNHYMYSFNRKKLCYLNETTYRFINLYLSGKDINDILIELKQDYDKNKLEYAKKQFIFYNDNFFFNETKNPDLTVLTGKFIENNIANVNVITFEVTQRCNLNCYYCTYGELYNNTENNHLRDLDFPKAKSLIDYMIYRYEDNNNLSTGRFLTIGFYGGEPLLNISFIKQMVNYLNKIKTPNIKIEYTMTTNGVLLDTYMDFLVENEFMIMISLDGDFASSEYRISKKGQNIYDKIISNITTLQYKYPEYFDNKIVFNSVLHDKNNLLDVIGFIKTKFNKTPKISEISQVSLSDNTKHIYNKIKKEAIEEITKYCTSIERDDYLILDPRIDILKKKFSLLVGNNLSNLGELLDIIENTSCIPTVTCIPFSFKLFVSADSNIHLCEKIGYKYSLGYIDKNNKVIFEFNQLAEKYNKYYNAIFAECFNCYNIYTCTTCLFEKDFKCKKFSENDYKKQLEYNTNLLLDLLKI